MIQAAPRRVRSDIARNHAVVGEGGQVVHRYSCAPVMSRNREAGEYGDMALDGVRWAFMAPGQW